MTIPNTFLTDAASPGPAWAVGGRDRRRAALMRRGEIRHVDLDPVRGTEADRRRPAVLVSDDRANGVAERLGRGVVTSDVARVHPVQVLLDALDDALRTHLEL